MYIKHLLSAYYLLSIGKAKMIRSQVWYYMPIIPALGLMEWLKW
jgi:hypothetical protein